VSVALLISLKEKQSWAMCQQHLAGIEGNDAAERAWANYLGDVAIYIKEAEAEIVAPKPDRYMTKGEKLERAVMGQVPNGGVRRRPDCEFKHDQPTTEEPAP